MPRVLGLLFFSASAPLAFGADAPLTPLTAPFLSPAPLTSSFGEYRPGHFHGGFDYSTGGRTGLPVRAPAAGGVSRLRASGVGYGKAVYFRTDDGRTVVYAHLSAFPPGVEAAVVREQDRTGRYEVDFTPAGSFRFEAGDTLAFTGGSGAGPPHLHVEVRVDASASVAENPVLHGWAVDDSIPPDVPRLRVEPAGVGALVDGGVDPVVVAWSPVDTPRIAVRGPVRLWVEAADRAGAGTYRLAPRAVRTELDGVEVSGLVLDRFDWNWPGEVAWVFHEPAARLRGERWISLNALPRSRQALYADGSAATFLPEPGNRKLRVTVTDFAGGTTVREAILVASPDTGSARMTRSAGVSAFESRGAFLHWVPPRPPGEVVASSSGALVERRPLRLRGPLSEVLQWGPPEPRTAAVWRFAAETGAVPLPSAVWMEAGSSTDTVRWEAGPVVVTAAPACWFEDGWVGVSGEVGGPALPGEPELAPVHAPVHLTPWGRPLRGRIRVWLPLQGASGEGVGLYSRRGEEWTYEGALRDGDRVGAELAHLETVALLRDRTPPRLEVVPSRGSGYRHGADVRVMETGSGVTWRTLALTMDGDPVIAEWDPDAQRLRSHLRAPLEPGEHTVWVQAADRAGNTVRIVETVTVE